jgi:hypothetical protein
MQKVSEMHDTDVKPPPGGNVVSGALHPGTGASGETDVVGPADETGVVEVVDAVEGVATSGAGLFGWRMTGRVADGAAHEVATRATSAPHTLPSRWALRPTLTCVGSPFPTRESSCRPPPNGVFSVVA